MWIEQTMDVRSSIIPMDNLFLGPGEYDPKKISNERHISTTLINPKKSLVDRFHPNRSGTAESLLSRSSAIDSNKEVYNNERFVVLFHHFHVFHY